MSGGVPLFVPVVLTDVECHAAAAACAAVATGAPIRLPLDHPLMTAALKINDAVRAAAQESEASS